MGFSGSTITAAKAELAQLSDKLQTENSFRLGQVYSSVPAVKDIDRQLKQNLSQLVAAAFRAGSDPKTTIERIKNASQELTLKRQRLLEQAGYPPDFTDHGCYCDKCSDRGYVGQEMCGCLRRLCIKHQLAELYPPFKTGNESFALFDLSLFSGSVDPVFGISPRENAKTILETCYDFAKSLGKKQDSLCLLGGSGLGKTYLSACIAKEAAENSLSVVYDSAIDFFNALEEKKFNGESLEADPTEKYFARDLLIIDDLGTEMRTQFTVSALYSVINTRLTKNKSTVITTGLTTAELRERYSPSIASRLLGEYTTCYLFGTDLRQELKNRNGR